MMTKSWVDHNPDEKVWGGPTNMMTKNWLAEKADYTRDGNLTSTELGLFDDDSKSSA